MPVPDPPETEPRREALASARAWLAEHGEAILQEQIEIARVPAPPFHEETRSRHLASTLESSGLPAELDEIGNLISRHPPSSQSGTQPPIVVAAHVDTVFGPDVDIRIRSEAGRWVGPGIADNARGLAVCLTVLRALRRFTVPLDRPVVFAFTVGEEGPGDLRGVKHLLREGGPLRHAEAFIAVDGSGLRRIIHHALGSLRYRATVRGPGGHSWSDWGRVNPAIAIGHLIQRLAALDPPARPRTTLTVARIGGGTSINSIPTEAWAEIDLRSEVDSSLRAHDARIREALSSSVAAAESRGSGRLTVTLDRIGERPAGMLEPDHGLVAAAEEATRRVGAEPTRAVSSTDANVPLALGIPAIAVGAGGRSGDTHTEHEWFENTDGALGALRLLDILTAAASL